MASIRSTIVGAFVTALSGAGKPADLTVDRFRSFSYTAADLPRAAVFAVKEMESGEARVFGSGDYGFGRILLVRVAVRVHVPTGTGLDLALDPYVAWVEDALAADATLGGRVFDVGTPKIEWGWNKEDPTIAEADMDYPMVYRTTRDSEVAA